jgi:pimeloyl-ACP methyl ester carboxylesterase
MPIVTQAIPFSREAGTGPGVVCLHSNASTSGQWRALIDHLAPRFHVFAVDSYDSGKSPAWPSDRVISLKDEVALIEPVLSRAGSPCMLVGHSYGAAVALMAALGAPGRVKALALYEPTLFSLLDAESPPPNEADGIRHAVAQAPHLMRATRIQRRGTSSTTGWVRGRGRTHRPRASHLWPNRSRMCGAGPMC